MGNRMDRQDIDAAISVNNKFSAEWQREHMESGFAMLKEISSHITDMSNDGMPVLSAKYLSETLAPKFRQLYDILLCYYEKTEAFERCAELVQLMQKVDASLKHINQIDEEK